MKIKITRSDEYIKAQMIATGRNVPEQVEADIDHAMLSDVSRAKIIEWWGRYPDSIYGISICESGEIRTWSNSGGETHLADIEAAEITPQIVDAYIASLAAQAEVQRQKYMAPVLALWPIYERDGAGAFLTPTKIHVLVSDCGVDSLDGYGVSNVIGDPLQIIDQDVFRAVIAERDRRNREILAAATGEYAARMADIARQQAAAEDAEATKQCIWISEHGSSRLQRLIAEDIECVSVYLEERLALERPGWAYDADVRGEAAVPRNSKQAGLDLLDEARKTASDAKLAWWVIAHQHDEDCDPEQGYDCDKKTDWKGYACTAKFLGREIVFGVPAAYALR